MQVAVTVSRRREPAAAADEAVRAARERVGGGADALLVFATTGLGDPSSLATAAAAAAGDAALVGCTSSGVLTGAGGIEEGAGVVAVAFAGRRAPIPLRSSVGRVQPIIGAGKGLGLLFTGSTPRHPANLADELATYLPAGTPIVGGVTAGAQGDPPACRFIGDELLTEDACGLALPLDDAAIVGYTHASRPLGAPCVVTSGYGGIIEELDGRPAFETFARRARPLLDDLPRAAQTVFVGLPMEPTSGQPSDGDPAEYFVCGIRALDPEAGRLAVTAPVHDGMRLQFVVRDRQAARADLRRLIDDARRRLAGRRPLFGLYVCCASRGRDFYGLDDHDTAFLGGLLGDVPLAGLFTGGQLAPTGSASYLHLFTGVLALVTG